MTASYPLDAIPPRYRERFIELVTQTDAFRDQYLDDDYKQICRSLAASVCQKKLPVLRGKAESWACGIAYAAGKVNFLSDPSREPYLPADAVAKAFGVSPATMYAKSRVVVHGLDLIQHDPRFMLPGRLEENPLVWMLTVNGVLTDIRIAPREAQVVAYEQGLIPYIPADREIGRRR